MWLAVFMAIAAFLIAGNLTQWDDDLMLCLIGLALGVGFNYTGHRIIGWGLAFLCGVGFALLLLFGDL